jgi:DNA-binding SARP family transcriptional activator
VAGCIQRSRRRQPALGLWRLQKSGLGIVDSNTNDLRLSPSITVDWRQVAGMARRLINRAVTMDADELGIALNSNLHDDLLPEMADEEWIAPEADCFRQLRLHALESLSERLIKAGWYGAAIDVAMQAVRVDPFRESAQQTLIQAHLAEGNLLAARQQYDAYRQMLDEELGLEPSARLTQLVQAHRLGGRNERVRLSWSELNLL